MTASPSSANAGPTLASLLAEQPVPGVPRAVQIVRQLAAQVTVLHEAGRLRRVIRPADIVFDDAGVATLTDPPAASEAALDDADVQALFPELSRLPAGELPADIESTRQRLREAGITFDPRQIDLCQLGILLCRLLTGEPAQSYLRSPRVKGKVPVELRAVLERALGCNGQERFEDAREFLAVIDAAAAHSAPAEDPPPTAAPVANDAATNEEPALPADRPTGDTTPSFVSSANTPADTSVGPSQPPLEGTPATDRRDPEAPLPFTRLAHYEIVGRIGHGGMGDVYRGYERTLDRPVAIKVLPADLAESAEFVRRFRTEAAAVARINHPNIVPIHFIGEDQGHHFYVMQLVEGESLASLLDRRGKLAVDETLAIVEHALAGLAAAHEQGMVHRDIKPGNILLDTRNRRALLADFGLVKSLEASVTSHTATGVIMGTVDYISPEQARGQVVDGRSDLYSVGVLLYQMLAGRLPFEADSPTALIFRHVYEQPPPLSEVAPKVPAALAAIIEKLLAKSPADRHQSADEVLADLRTFRTGQPVPPRRSGRATGQTTIVRLPALNDEEPLLPARLSELAIPNWWQRTRGRALSLFRRHAPEALQQLQNTQQQVDGAVAEYDRQERHLRQLTRDAESVLAELNKLAGEHRAAALAAGERARSAGDPTTAAQAYDEQAASERAAVELDRQTADQQEQLDSIRLRLARVQTQAQELRNRRDILNARLKAAYAGRQMAAGGGGRPLRRGWRLALQTAAVILVGPLIFGVVRYATNPEKAPGKPSKVGSGSAGASSHVAAESPPIFNMPDGKVQSPLAAPATRLRQSSQNAGTEKHLAVSRDGVLLAVSTYVPPNRDQSSRAVNEIKVWNLKTGDAVLSLDEPHHVMNLAVSPDGSKLCSVGTVVGTETTEYKVWDLQSGKVALHGEAGIPQHKPSVGFSWDSKSAYFLLGASLTQQLGILDVKTGKLEHMKMPQSGDQATAAAFSPVNAIAAIGIVVTSGGRCEIDIHDLRQRKLVHSLTPGNTVYELQFSRDGGLLCGTVWGTIAAWETANWTQVASFPVAKSFHDRLAVSADGRYIASLLNGKVDIHNVASKASIPLSAPFTCRDLVFTPGGTLIVAPEDLRFSFFNPESGKEQLTPVLAPKS